MPSKHDLSKGRRITSWILQLTIAAVFVMAGLTKLTGAPESVAVFETLGAEPLGRYATGIAELAAALLLIIPRSAAFGALFSTVLMAGAIGSHLTKLGVQIELPEGGTDGGAMFGLAVGVFLAAGVVLFIRRKWLPRPNPAA